MDSLIGQAKCMALTLSTDGLITSISAPAQMLTGYTPSELIGRPITEILTDQAAFEVPRMIDAALARGFWEGEIEYRDRSGTPLRAQSKLMRLDGQGNACFGFMLVSSTDRIPLASLGNQSAAVGQKLRRFAHELNNPLAVMMGFGQLLLLNSECGGRIRADLEKIFSELQRLAQTVEQLHEYGQSLQLDPRGEINSESGLERVAPSPSD